VSRPIGILAAACLAVLAFPNFNLSLLAWVALVPLIFAIEHKTPRQAFFYGWLSGTLAYCGILFWLVVTFHAATLSLLLGLSCLIALSAYVGLYWGAWAWFVIHLTSPHSPFGRPLPNGRGENEDNFNFSPSPVREKVGMRLIIASAFWVVLEYIRTTLFSGFPWALLADSQVHHLPLLQIASITGVYGVSFLIVWGNLAIARALKGSFKPLGAFVFVLLVVLGYGYLQLNISALGNRTPLKIALLQGDIDQYKKWNETYVAEIEQTYQTLSERATLDHVDLIIWPETSAPGYLMQESALRLWLTQLILKSHASHLVGAPASIGKKSFNAAFSLSPIGWIQGMYAKKHLVPFGEIVPFQSVLGAWIPVLNVLGGFDAGEDSAVLMAANVPVAMNICYEALFPNLVRRSVQQGGQLIVNITNDGWYMKTAEPYQHLAPNVFRAIENDRWLARADNTGVSAIIAPTGEIVAQTPIYLPRELTGTVYARTHRTFYTRFGDVFAWFCLFAVLVFVYRKKSGMAGRRNSGQPESR
jgi:apolipoprotein N-acyltransferase